jgi:hypothetical protein
LANFSSYLRREIRIKEILAFTHHQIIPLKLEEVHDLITEIKKLDDQWLAVKLNGLQGVSERLHIL